MMEKRIGIVIRDHEAAYPVPLIVKTGEALSITTRQSEWPGWLWCVNSAGRGGWVPEVWIDRDEQESGGGGRMLRDYDASELNARIGEQLIIELAEAGRWSRYIARRNRWPAREFPVRADPEACRWSAY